VSKGCFTVGFSQILPENSATDHKKTITNDRMKRLRSEIVGLHQLTLEKEQKYPFPRLLWLYPQGQRVDDDKNVCNVRAKYLFDIDGVIAKDGT
jgi:hypothetical protein